MEALRADTINRLRSLVREVGNDGGKMGPSIYDTAYVARICPLADGNVDAMRWLVSIQQEDGGWGDIRSPYGRDVPTLASLLGLASGLEAVSHRDNIERGLAFMVRQSAYWTEELSDDLPIGIELILPQLLADSRGRFNLSTTHYSALIALGDQRRRRLAASRPKPGTAPTHSWESWGDEPRPDYLHASEGVGCSPAATAAWLSATRKRGVEHGHVSAAERYLANSEDGSDVDVPGVVPVFWPSRQIEQIFVPYALLLGGLLDHPALRSSVITIVRELQSQMSESGLGMARSFVPDGDDTAVGLAVICGAGVQPAHDPLRRFDIGTHYETYPGELQPSPSTTAHAVHALSLIGRPAEAAVRYLKSRQTPDGIWVGDKWHTSWLYTTSQASIALMSQHALSLTAERDHILRAILARQYPEGGWGSDGLATLEETSYAMLAIHALCGKRPPAAIAGAVSHGLAWMQQSIKAPETFRRALWVDKERYLPRRMTSAFELVGFLVALEMAGI
jgi:halimadienyl-diphosphate synthase